MPEATPGGIDASGGVHLPAARSAGLIVTASDDELVIYDERARHIHQLNAVSAAVWRHCDGRRTVAEIAVAASEAIGATLDGDAMAIAISRLDDANLLAGPVAAPRTSRRRFTRRRAMLGAAAVPAIVSITAPLASASASTLTCPLTGSYSPFAGRFCKESLGGCFCYDEQGEMGKCQSRLGSWICA